MEGGSECGGGEEGESVKGPRLCVVALWHGVAGVT